MKNSLRTIVPVIIISLSLFVFNFCLKDNFDLSKLTKTNWNPSLAVPLVHSSLGVYDIIARVDTSDLIVIDQNTGLLALVYEGELFSYSAESIVPLTDQDTSLSIGMLAAEITTLTGSGTFSKNTNFVYGYNTGSGEEIDSLVVKSGTLEFTISNAFPGISQTIQVSAPALTYNGVPFNKTISIAPTTILPAVQIYDLTDHVFDMTLGGTTINKIPIDITTTITYNAGDPVPTTGDNISITQSFKGLQFKRLYGYIGQKIISIDDDSIAVKLFNNSIDGFFHLADPKVNIKITNSCGLPIEVEFTNFQSLNTSTGVATNILYGGFPNPFTIGYPTYANVGDSVETNYLIDKTNSNIAVLIEPTPKYIVHSIQAITNPPSEPTVKNFITDESFFRVDTELELPLVGYAHSWDIRDTIPFEFTDNMEEIESVLIRTNFDNWFPVNIKTQLYFLDANYVVLDSLMDPTNSIIESAIVDVNGKSTSSTVKITDISYSQSRVPALLNAKYIDIVGRPETIGALDSPPKEIKLYEYYTIDMRIGVMVNGKITF